MSYIVIVLVVFIAAWTGYEIGRAPLVEDVNEYGEPNEDTQENIDYTLGETEFKLHPRQAKALKDAAEPTLEDLVNAEEQKRTQDKVF